MSELLHHDQDDIDPDGPNDIYVSRMIRNGCSNNDFTIADSPAVQLRIREKSTNSTIFSLQSQRKSDVSAPYDLYSQ